MTDRIQIGIAGSGFIAEGLASAALELPDIEVVSVLSRRPATDLEGTALGSVTIHNSVDDFLNQKLDCVVECSGDPVYGTETAAAALDEGLPVVTMNSELQVVSGSFLQRKGLLSEAEGDQPGSQAALRRDIMAMGFRPLVYGNIKGFLNHTPTPEDMSYWAKKSGISVPQVTSFTDGTKVQIEQALVANAFNADLIQSGMRGLSATDLQKGSNTLAAEATAEHPVSDYLLAPNLPASVFIAAEHDDTQQAKLAYYKMGQGPYYTFLRPFHLCHLEIPKTVREIVRDGRVLLNNGSDPTINVAAVAKEVIRAGTFIKRGLGSFTVRGEAIRISENPEAVPIGLIQNATAHTDIEPGQTVTFRDVEIGESLALQAWQQSI